MYSGFLRPEKTPSISVGIDPANDGSRGENVSPRPPRPTNKQLLCAKIYKTLFFSHFRRHITVGWNSYEKVEAYKYLGYLLTKIISIRK